MIYLQCTRDSCRAIGVRARPGEPTKLTAATVRCELCGAMMRRISAQEYDQKLHFNWPPLERPDRYQGRFVEARKGYPSPPGQQPLQKD